MALSDSYYVSRSRKRKLAFGGQMTPEEEAKMATIGGAAGLAGGFVDALNTPNQYGRQSTGGMAASGALKGAAAGASLGPIGAVAGGVIGGVTGLIQGNSARKAEQEMIARQKLQTKLSEQAAMDARLSANPTLATGSLSAQYFAKGGFIGGDPPAKKPLSSTDYKNWNSVVAYARSKNLTPEQLDHDPSIGYGIIDEYNKANPNAQFDRNRVQDIQSLMQDYRQKSIDRFKAYTPAMLKVDNPAARFGDDYSRFMPGLSKADNFPGSRTLNWQVPSEYLKTTDNGISTTKRVGFAPVTTETPADASTFKYTDKPMTPAQAYLQKQISQRANGGMIPSTPVPGGNLKPLSSDGVLVQGNTHAQGGVQIPGAEVENQETIKNNFVYSAQLGFAQKSKPLMKAKGKIEQKPATPERINALKRIEDKENQLAVAQEYMKKKFGLH